MPPYSPDRWDALIFDVGELKSSFARHEERHGDDADMLQLVLQDLRAHTNNHHGRASTIKQGGWVAAALGILYAIAEVIRQIFL